MRVFEKRYREVQPGHRMRVTRLITVRHNKSVGA
jgi:hypothetical protein